MRITSAAMAALAFSGLILGGLGNVRAADLDLNAVTVGYTDGYMGTDHQFHAWEHRSDAESFRYKHANLYHPRRHDDPRHPSSGK
jgi:hypothetical protein